MFVYVYILNKIHASSNAVPLILMHIGGKIPFMTSTQKMIAWSDFQKMPHHLSYSFILLFVLL